jgi:hypothetical protein
MLVGARIFFLFESIQTSFSAYPATYSADTSVLFHVKIGQGVFETTDL